MASNEAKARGNAAFTAQRYEEAVAAFSEAIAVDPENHILYSNRSGAYAAMKNYDLALQDAEKCVALNGAFVKGYSRKGLALFNLGQVAAAKETYQKGLGIDAANEQLKEGLEQCEEALKPAPKSMFGGPEVWAKLAANPKTAPLLANPQMVNKIKMLQANPSMMSQFLQDPQMMTVLSVMLGIDFSSMGGAPGGGAPFGGAADANMSDAAFPSASASAASASSASGVEIGSDSDDDDEDAPRVREASSAPKPKAQAAPAAAPAPKQPEPAVELSAEERELRGKRKAAEEAKAQGNEFYKKRQFEAAVEQYNRAIELDGANPNYVLNRAAVRLEQKQYDECLADCRAVVDIAQEQHTADASVVLSKAYSRMGNTYVKMQQYEEAIKFLKKSLLEVGDNAVRQKLKEAEQLKKLKDEADYLDPVKAAEANELGKAAFTAGKWPDAIGHYSEAIKRNPKDAKLFSNRAACYTKLMAFNEALSDCEQCLKIDPAFVKAHTRRGRIQHAMKEFHKALASFDEALKLDPQNEDAMEARQTTRMAIAAANSGQEEMDPERHRRAMEDPEIRSILNDPIMARVLQDMQTNPKSGQAALKDPSVRAKLEKLIAAGVIRVG